MKKIFPFITLLLFGLFNYAHAQTSDVTFQVDMRGYLGGSYTEVNLNGNFAGWCGACIPMTDADMDSIWEVTVNLADTVHEYKFTVDGWTDQENFGGGETCTVTNFGFTNRVLTVAGDTTLPVVCWNSCDPCGAGPAPGNITFQVDMNDYTGSYTTVYVSANFNGWSGNANPLSDADMDGVWTGVIPIAGGNYEFKYSVDDWADQEQFQGGEPCTISAGGFTNRTLSVDGDATLPVNCWASCDTCGTAPPDTASVTFQVDMSQYAGTYTEVNLNGNFAGWCGACIPMADPDMDDVYSVTLDLPHGMHEYKFTVDGWTDQENFPGGEPCTITTGGFTNRLLDLSSDSTLAEVCWNSCDPCGAAPPDTASVTFQVDMSQYAGTYTEVNLNGNFAGWCGACIPMTDPDMDDVYSVTIDLPHGMHEFKFTVDGWADQENFVGGETCTVTNGGFTNRSLDLSSDSTLGVVCWNSCDPCMMGPPDTASVTFQVDMSQYAGSYTEVNLNGNFAGWCGACIPMTDPDMDDIYTVTIDLPHGAHEFKYTVDGWTDQENFIGGEPCTITTGGFTNRLLNLSSDSTLGVVCWNSCDTCSLAPIDTGSVTFQVDMNNYTGTYTDVNLNGNFAGWCGACIPMTDPDMDGIYSVTLDLPHGAHEYKFTVDGWADQENFAGGEVCTITTAGFTNRLLNLSSDTTLAEVCWNSCDPCMISTDSSWITFQVDMNYYTGTYTDVNLNGAFNGWCGGCTPMSDPDMDGIYSVSLYLAPGQYQYKFTVDAWTDQEQFSGGEPCTITLSGFTNRLITVPGGVNDTLPEVCWNSCTDCASSLAPGDITFSVDMNNYSGVFTTVYVAGTFNGWCGNCNALSDADMDGVWEGTFNLGGGPIEFKYELDDWAVQENLTPGDSCTLTTSGFTNRYYTVNGDETLATVCWESCSACAPVTPCSHDAFEPNNMMAEASMLPQIGIMRGANICTLADEDWYEFVVNANKPNIRVYLKGMSDYFDLELYNDGGAVIDSSYSANTINESITANNLAAGSYFLRVFPGMGALGNGSSYLLRAHARSTAFMIPSKSATPTRNLEESLTIYPNPTEGNFFIRVETLVDTDATISVKDLRGSTVLHTTTNFREGMNTEEISLNNVAPGLYIVTVTLNGQNYIQKLQISK